MKIELKIPTMEDNKKTGEKMRVVNLLQFTNINVLPFSDNI